MPLGLIINELTSNSIQHAFDLTESPKITIRIRKQNHNKFILNYTDNGIWKTVKENYSSFGLELLDILASQLDGGFDRESNSKGTKYVFNLQDVDLKD